MDKILKKLRRFGLLVFIAAAACVVFSSQAQAAPSRKKVTKAYRKYASQNDITKFKQEDIDGNGIREMLYRDVSWNIGVCTYSAKKKKVVKIKEISAGKAEPVIYYSKGKDTFFMVHADTGGYTAYAIRLKGTKKKTLRKMVHTNGKYKKRRYRINGKKYTQSKFLNILNQYYRWNSKSLR